MPQSGSAAVRVQPQLPRLCMHSSSVPQYRFWESVPEPQWACAHCSLCASTENQRCPCEPQGHPAWFQGNQGVHKALTNHILSWGLGEQTGAAKVICAVCVTQSA